MPLFKRKTTQASPPANSNFDPQHTRRLVFNALAKRIGEDNATAMRKDFDAHLEADATHGVEAAYTCLVGKLVDFIDVLNDEVEGDAPLVSPAQIASPFNVFRKDV